MLNRICGMLADDPPVIPTPTTAAVSPDGAPVCGGAAVYITGTGFYGPIDAVSVTINGVACTDVERVTPRLLRVIVPMGAAHDVAYDVVLTTAAGTDTLAGAFTYTPSAFTLTGIAPNGGREDGAITLTGTGFLDVDDVLGNGFSLAVWAIVDDRHITATVEPQGPPTPYTASIEVERVLGPPVTLSISYECFDGAPLVTSLSPSGGFAVSDTPITNLAGQNFIAGATITFGGVPATDVVFVSSTQLTCTAPAHADGAVDVVVTNPDAQDSGASGAGTFTYHAAPTVSAVTPVFGITGGGTFITDLAGNFFQNGATVEIGGAPATSVTYVSPTKLTCRAPAGAFGAADVLVTNPDAQDSGASGNGLFIFYAKILFTGLNPGVYSQTAFLNLTGLSNFSRADSTPTNCVTVQDSAATVYSGIGQHYARIYDDGTHKGFLIEQSVKQILTGTNPPRDINSGWSASGQGSQTSNYTTSPDGQTKASRLNIASLNNIANYGDLGSDTTVRYCFSTWQRSKSAASNGDMQVHFGNAANTAGIFAILAPSNTWKKMVVAKGTTPLRYIYNCYTWNASGFGGQTARARDVLCDFMQCEPGDFATSCITKGSGARERDIAEWAMPTSDQRIRFYARFRPLFASTSQVFYNNAGTPTAETEWIIFQTTTPSNYLSIKDSDKKLYCKIGGVGPIASTNTIAFAAFDDVEILIEVGNNVATTLKVRVNAGEWTDLAMAAINGDPTPTSDTRLMSGTASAGVVLPCLLEELRSYPVEITESDL